MDVNMLAPASLKLLETSVGVMVLGSFFPLLSEHSSCNAPQLKIEEGNAVVGWIMSRPKTMDGSTREGFPVKTVL